MTQQTAPDWTQHVMWWQVYPLGALGAPIRPDEAPTGAGGDGRTLRDLIGWLDHLIDLGLNGLALGPVFASGSHGYDTVDFDVIDPRLGDRADFDALVAACHERGIRVLLDGVFNHVGEHHPWVRQALAEGPAGARADFFRIDWDAAGGPRPADFEGHGSLVALNHSNPAVAAEVARVMIQWLDAGADGWRLDAAYAVPAAFWARVLPRVRERHPQAWFVGEMIHGDYPGYVSASGLDSVTQYELWKAIWSSLREENLFELDWNLRRHGEFAETFAPMTFVGNHDVTRIASRVGADKAVLAATVLFTVAGVPSVYYGDEWGLEALKEERIGGDDAIRPALPDAASATDLSGTAHGDRVQGAYRALAALRRRHPWLHRARTTMVELTNTRCVYRCADPGSDAGLEVELDLTGAGRPVARVLGAHGEVLFAG
ncbi:alpha-amylase family protein [Serinibacter salmoneus]|uniref:Glycosidase n=1 Tax=Serinibacter salmoneus TaxID=556530 RepID=A0A2A9D1P0_9MICO|nr:alpha-amylase family protein [Serinibacter salmoneus]PFG20584.1 glycosidase [Serinibacter salmoneus]